jgi:hypothetical protein
VVFYFNGTTFATKSIKILSPYPVWNERFEFDVYSMKDYIRFQYMAGDAFLGDYVDQVGSICQNYNKR